MARRTSVRKVRRHAGERLPFIPFGLVPAIALLLVALFAIFPFAYGYVEGVTHRTAQRALIESGASWAVPRVSGQWVTLTGHAPSQAEADQALNAVRQARAKTLFGSAIPATRVRADFSSIGEDGAPVARLGGEELPEWSFTLRDGVLTLDGDVPNRQVRDRVVEAANAQIDPPRLVAVEDSLTILNRPSQEGFLQASLRGVNTVAMCEKGVSNFLSGEFSLNCELPEAKAGEVRARAIAPLELGSVGAVQLLTHEAVSTCEGSLEDLLGNTKIEFESSSAVVDNSSAPLLDLVVDAIRTCPGTLRIEGHTDSTGLDAGNIALSQARAEAVRNALIVRGVPARRLVAEGFGASRPIDTNSSADGRARNRRIEIRVVRSTD